MADIVLYDRVGDPVTYEGIETITTDTPDAEKGATFTYGVAVENAEYEPNFSNGNQKVILEKGQLLKEFTLKKPETLLPEHIKKGVEVAGVLGGFAGDETEKTVGLNMADGNQVIEADEDTVMKRVTVNKPTTMVPENIKKGVDIGGITGTYEVTGIEKTIDLNMVDGDQVIEASEGSLFSKVVIKKPEDLIEENIVKDKTIGGIVGSAATGGDFDVTDTLLKYFTYSIDESNKTIMLYSILYDKLYADNGNCDVTVPDKIGGYNVTIVST